MPSQLLPTKTTRRVPGPGRRAPRPRSPATPIAPTPLTPRVAPTTPQRALLSRIRTISLLRRCSDAGDKPVRYRGFGVTARWVGARRRPPDPRQPRGSDHVRRLRRDAQPRRPAARAGARRPGARRPAGRADRGHRLDRPGRRLDARAGPGPRQPPARRRRPCTTPPPTRSTAMSRRSHRSRRRSPTPSARPRRWWPRPAPASPGSTPPARPSPTSAGEPDPDDLTLADFTPPASGHQDWLAVALPGLVTRSPDCPPSTSSTPPPPPDGAARRAAPPGRR